MARAAVAAAAAAAAAAATAVAVVLLMVAASAAAAAIIPASAAAEAVAPPFPVPSNDSLGAFHLLAALQCGAPGGGGGGGGDGGGGGGGGGGGDARGPPGGPAACASPVTDAAAIASWRRIDRPSAGSSAATAPEGGVMTGFRGDWLHWGEQLDRLRNWDSAGRRVHAVTFSPVLPETAATAGRATAAAAATAATSRPTQLVQEAAVMRMLTLQRNSVSGALLRLARLYDVLAIARVTVGVCQTKECQDLSAVNVIGSRRGDYYNKTHLPLLMYKNAEVASPVSMADEDLLTLGRAAVVDPSWLGEPAAHSWAIRAGFTLTAKTKVEAEGTPPVETDPLGPAWNVHSMWDPADRSAAAAAGRHKWLQAVAYVFCRPPMALFVAADRARLCGSNSDDDGGAAPVGSPHQVVIYAATWTFDPDHKTNYSEGPPEQQNASALPHCAFSNTHEWNVKDTLVRPAWLLGHSSREINRQSAAEVALAQSLTPCAHALPGRDGEEAGPEPALTATTELPRIKWSTNVYYASMREVTRELAGRYNRSAWGVPPPGDPASATAIVLGIIVVLPEAIAIVALLLSTRVWGARDVGALAIIAIGGLISTAGLVWLTVEEAAGARWRGASLRDELTATLPGWGGAADVYRSLEGASLVRVQTLYLGARRGYRVGLLAGLTGAVGVAYVALFFAAAAVALRGQWRPRKE